MSNVVFADFVRCLAPVILALLEDGLPRGKRAIVAALEQQHPKDEVIPTLMRLAITDRLVEAGGKYSLPAEPASV